MKFRNRKRWRIIADYMIGWTTAFVFLGIIRGVGTQELGSVQFDLWLSMVYSLILGPVFGGISGFAQILIEERMYKNVSIQRLLISRLLFAIVFLLSLIVVSYLVVTQLLAVEINFIDFLIEPGSFAIYFYLFCVDLFLAILRQVNLMLGERNLGKLIRGQFYDPHEEERIFMFLDLQSSTELAERLGHIKYSRLIQDCFNDLGVVVENEAEVYQYVGDEVILTWKLNDGLRRQNCVYAYFNFKKQLERKRAYYEEHYGCLPFFKAGMNSGVVTVTEVGKYKKEIAYHGDTINTAARIQGKCNELHQELLISERLKTQLHKNGFEYNEMGSVALKGKGEKVPVYGVKF